MIKKHFNKEILIKKTTKILRTPLNVGSLTFDNNVKVRDHCHTTVKYRGYAHRDCNINLKSNHKIHVVFNNLKIMILVLLSKN